MSLIPGKPYNSEEEKKKWIDSYDRYDIPPNFQRSLIPGKVYNFQEPTPSRKYTRTGVSIILNKRKGIFIEYITNRWNKNNPYCIFEEFIYDNYHKIGCKSMYESKDLKFIINTEPIFAKQVARGLCDRIPEDCAGIIERMLIGDKIVGQGPDIYPQRMCDANGVYHV